MEVAARKVTLKERVRLKRTGRGAAAILNLIIIKQCQQNRCGKKDHLMEVVANMKLKISTRKGNQYHRKAENRIRSHLYRRRAHIWIKLWSTLINIRSIKRITSIGLGTCQTQKMKTERRGKHVHANVNSLNKKLRCMLPTQVTKDKVVVRGRYVSVFQKNGFCKYGEHCKFAHTRHIKPINQHMLYSQYTVNVLVLC